MLPDRALEYLLRNLLLSGCKPEELQTGLYGGGRVLAGNLESIYDVAGENIKAARHWIAHYGLRLVESNTGGILPRKLTFVPATGETRCVHPSVLPGQVLL